jgi:hypothetical protein
MLINGIVDTKRSRALKQLINERSRNIRNDHSETATVSVAPHRIRNGSVQTKY